MKVKCCLTLLELKKKGDGMETYHELENFFTSLATHARLDLFSLEGDNKELIKSSMVFTWDEKENSKNKLCVNLHFCGFTWRYDCKNGEIMLYNREIKI